MKRILFALLLIPFFTSCKDSPQQKAEKVVTVFLKESLHDWNSYESVKWSKLDSVFTIIDDDETYINAINKTKLFDKKVNEADQRFWTYKGESAKAKTCRQNIMDEQMAYLDSMSTCAKIMIDIENNFVPAFKGWSIQHSFRAKNASGNKTIAHYLYFFDKDLTKIVKVENISE